MGFNTFDSSGKQQLVNSIANMPFGSIIDWPTDTAPAGWLKCDGSAVSRTTYQDLFLAIGTNYGVGNGSTTFNVPDITGSIIYASAVAKAGSNLLPAVSDGAVTTAKLADNAVTTAKLIDSSVTFAKLGWPIKTSLASTPAEFSTSSGSATDVTGASISVSETAGGFTIVQHSCQLKSTGGSGEAYSWIHSDSSVGSVGANTIGQALGSSGAATSAIPRTKVVSGTYTWVGSTAVNPCPTTRTTTYKIQISAGVSPSAFINNITLTAWTFNP